MYISIGRQYTDRTMGMLIDFCLVLLLIFRSPELSSSRDEDDGGYTSTRVEEVSNINLALV